jgi:hypothetical protein
VDNKSGFVVVVVDDVDVAVVELSDSSLADLKASNLLMLLTGTLNSVEFVFRT